MASIFNKEPKIVSVTESDSLTELRGMLQPNELKRARSELNRVVHIHREYMTAEVIESFKVAIAKSIISQRF